MIIVLVGIDRFTCLKENCAKYNFFNNSILNLKSILKNKFFRYPNYEVYGDSKISNMAKVHSRYTIDSLVGVVVDIELLSRYILIQSSQN